MIELRNVVKSFGATRALAGVTLQLKSGEVHGLAGVNGAGKSTLIRILAGAITDFEGEMVVDGAPVRFVDPNEARRARIAVVHQESSLVASLSVEDAVLLGLDDGPMFGLIDRKARRARARRILAAIDLEMDPEQLVEELPLAAKQLVQLARALAGEPRVLVMDEPTSALGERDSAALLDRMRSARARGASVLYCTHRTSELYDIADRITVLRDGATVAHGTPAELPRKELMESMLGQPESELAVAGERAGDDRAPSRRCQLRAVGVARAGWSRALLSDVSFAVGVGEVVGLASVRDGGAETLLEVLCGLVAPSGSMELDGRAYAPRSPGEAARAGVLLLAADRSASVLSDMSIEHNASLSALGRFCRAGVVQRTAERAATNAVLGRAGVKTRSGSDPWTDDARTLSGGNQQKVAFARCLLAEPRLLLLHEPTRGVDVGAQRDLHAMVRKAATTGISVIVASSELDELLAICDRVVALAAGRVAASFQRREFDRSAIARATLQAAEA